ncbi:hypothetical protein H311_00250 [Anncaliia algerae PRA109]|nr:hypothetical protein H311_00250 [Anncaliia algerae PRA109]
MNAIIPSKFIVYIWLLFLLRFAGTVVYDLVFLIEYLYILLVCSF